MEKEHLERLHKREMLHKARNKSKREICKIEPESTFLSLEQYDLSLPSA